MPGLKVIIVGGGLAGALLANGLINNHVDVTVYERDQEKARREGYQIRLGEPSLSAFRACLAPHQVKDIEQKFGVSSDDNEVRATYVAPCIYSTKFRPVLDLGQLPNYTVSAAISRTVLRNFLIDPVVKAGRIQFNKAFSHYSIVEGKEEKVRVHFADGSSDICDVLVGADGSGSKINRQLGLNNIVDIKSHWAFVCKGDLPPHRVKRLPSRLQEGPLLLFHNGITLYYALYMPQRRDSETASNVLFNYDYDEASFYWSLIVPKELIPNFNESDQTSRLQSCLDCVKDWAPEFTTMLSIGDGDGDGDGAEASVIMLRASVQPSLDWRAELQHQYDEQGGRRGYPRVWLMGDAVHAMQPNRGMGGNQSMYDCVEMLPALLELNARCQQLGLPASSNQVQAALRTYESKMIPRAFKWVAKSGGTSPPKISFDGILGLLLSTFSPFILSAVSVVMAFGLAVKRLVT